MKIDLHFAGFFTRYPEISYTDGAEQRFEDVDFARMDRNEFVEFLQRSANEMCVNGLFLHDWNRLSRWIEDISY